MAFSAEDIVPDSPTNNFATWNPLAVSTATFSNGNLNATMSSSAPAKITSTFAVSAGKYYMELEFTGNANYPVGISADAIQRDFLGNADGNKSISFWPYNNLTSVYINGVSQSFSGSTTTWASGDIIGIELDADNEEVSLYKNGNLVGSSVSYSSYVWDKAFFAAGNYINGNQYNSNFGQDPTFGGTKPVGNYAFNTAKIYSVFGGSERSANYTVEYSDDNSNWTTAWTGVMSNNTATGIQQGTGGGGSYGTHKYWRYVEGSAVVGHHPRISRIILSDGTNDTNLIVYNYDNSSDVGEYQPGTVAREISEGYTDANGIGAFFYQPPTGALALCTANLPDFTPTVIDDVPKDYFKAVTWTGDGIYPRSISTDFAPDLIWTKARTLLPTVNVNSDHLFMDSVRGDGNLKWISSSQTNAEGTYYDNADADLTSSGFTIQSTTGTNALNDNNAKFVAWCFRAGGPPDLTSSPTKPFAKNGVQYETLSAANITAGTITPTAMSVNTDAGFSIIQWTGNGLASKTIGHGLDVRPAMIIHKDLDGTDAWLSWHQSLSSGYYIQLSESNQAFNNVDVWPSAGITSSVITTTANATRFNNYNGERHIAYCFAEVEGYSKFGSYTGNGSPDGPFVYCGFRPAFLLRKNITNGGTGYDWVLIDNARSSYNLSNNKLYPNLSNLENVNSDNSDTGTNSSVDLLSNGFKVRAGNARMNGSNQTYIFMAFAEQPFKFSNAR